MAAHKIVLADPSLRYTGMWPGYYATNKQSLHSVICRGVPGVLSLVLLSPLSSVLLVLLPVLVFPLVYYIMSWCSVYSLYHLSSCPLCSIIYPGVPSALLSILVSPIYFHAFCPDIYVFSITFLMFSPLSLLCCCFLSVLGIFH